ncbi:hypothetical protein [Carnobacterium gallinarum]|uniref:hypothetical protein n=1 Tax=Carnobacterium gallinarum TaxID=2749 RepID=UPI00147026AD|nr:hypothetical protein [Carnobacterium gallinarum]
MLYETQYSLAGYTNDPIATTFTVKMFGFSLQLIASLETTFTYTTYYSSKRILQIAKSDNLLLLSADKKLFS